jgi:NitT/TauT family transport system substrate-binding protein
MCAMPGRHHVCCVPVDLCVSQSESVARRMVDGGFAANYYYALETLRTRATTAGASSIPRTHTHARGRHDHVCPNQLIVDGTNWRFLNEIKRELKV